MNDWWLTTSYIVVLYAAECKCYTMFMNNNYYDGEPLHWYWVNQHAQRNLQQHIFHLFRLLETPPLSFSHNTPLSYYEENNATRREKYFLSAPGRSRATDPRRSLNELLTFSVSWVCNWASALTFSHWILAVASACCNRNHHFVQHRSLFLHLLLESCKCLLCRTDVHDYLPVSPYLEPSACNTHRRRRNVYTAHAYRGMPVVKAISALLRRDIIPEFLVSEKHSCMMSWRSNAKKSDVRSP